MVDDTDKFILMNMDDERSKKIAEVLGNKTCKKILDYLTENSNKSEEDISNDLKMPINTVEYNLKKLLKTGLIEKSTNFFWSKRGKKIILYKPAKKHIIISPKDSKFDFKILNSILPVILIAVAILAIIFTVNFNNNENNSGELRTFQSLGEMEDFLKEHQSSSGGMFLEKAGGQIMTSNSPSAADSESGSNEYSQTNIQVEGVDEADIIKNDGKYIYAVSGNKISIIDAYPADEMEILSEITIENTTIRGIFINENKLIVFSDANIYFPYKTECIDCVVPPEYSEEKSLINVYDISNKENPILDNEASISGNYFDSRMIGNYIYVIANKYIGNEITLPYIMNEDEKKIIEPTEIYYQEYEDYGFQYTIILALDLDNYEISEKAILTGYTQNIYVSENNIYTIATQYNWNENTNSEKTLINKISIDKLNIEFLANGNVPGHILNQFSLDEFDGNLRIATTVGEVWNSENPSQNNIYILNDNLNITGRLENLAPGESIYSVRFMGDRGYIVTFKKVDPLFVIDLSDETNPIVLGKLKIPGYSDYLQPYDETHIIGIGKEAINADEDEIENRNLNFAWYQGIKIAIFDVTDVENPVEMHKIVIGDRGTDSEALYNHKALLFDKEKELFVLPITLAEYTEEPEYAYEYGDYTFQGAYVYNLNLEEGFDLKGRMTHYNETEINDKSGYYWYGGKDIQRSLYIENTLYTFSNKMIKANNLNNLEEISFVNLPYENFDYPILY